MKKLSILYVEDDPEVQKHISEFLKRYCRDVYLADNAEEGYELFSQHQTDIVMLDINLPGMSGMDLAEKIRSLSTNVRIIMATAYTDKEFLLQAIELNLIRYLVKPITSDDLYDVFEKCINTMDPDEKFARVDLGHECFYQPHTKELIKEGEIIVLRKKEMELLEFFVAHANEIVTYEMLETMVWKDMLMTQDAIRSQIKNLRKKIHTKLFTNVSGIGYKLQRV